MKHFIYNELGFSSRNFGFPLSFEEEKEKKFDLIKYIGLPFSEF